LPPHPAVAYLCVVRFMSVLDVVCVVALIAAAGTAPLLFARWSMPKFIFGIAVLVGLLVAATSTSISQFQIQQLLESVPHGASVSIDGHPVQNSDQILNMLRGLRDLPAHHSHPTKRIRIDINGSKHLILELGRDSDNPQEYWVFYPRHLITRSNEIGRIITPLFDAY
jgi:hypothetical protein